MKEDNHSYNSHRGSDGNSEHKLQRPYYKRAHKDWRFWAVVILMIIAMLYYVLSDDFSMRLRARPPYSSLPGKERSYTDGYNYGMIANEVGSFKIFGSETKREQNLKQNLFIESRHSFSNTTLETI